MDRRAAVLGVLIAIACLCTPAAGETLRGVIEASKGLVQVRLADDQPWQVAKPGLAVTEGAELRTGPRSAVQVRIEPDQVIILDRLGTMKLAQAVRLADGKIKTDVGMPYGRMRYRIEQAGLEHDSTIHMPSAVLGIRGSEMDVWEEFRSGPRSRHHRATFTPFDRNPIVFGEGMGADADQPDPGTNREYQDLVNPRSTFLNRHELHILARRPDGAIPNGHDGPQSVHDLHNVSSFTHLDFDNQTYYTTFTMTWSSTLTTVAADDLNLFVYDSVSGQYVSGSATDINAVLAAGYGSTYPGTGPVQTSTNGGELVTTGDGFFGRTEVIRYDNYIPGNGTFGAQIVGRNDIAGTDNAVNIQVREYLNGQLYNMPPAVMFNLDSIANNPQTPEATGPSVPPNHPFNDPTQ